MRLFSGLFRALVGGSFTTLQKCSQCILQPQLTGPLTIKTKVKMLKLIKLLSFSHLNFKNVLNRIENFQRKIS